MATESSPPAVHYLTYPEAVTLHIMLMRRLEETHVGVFDRFLVESALARPRHAATYEGADLIRQAATLCFGLIKNHPWRGGNKRTATILVDRFLYLNGIELRTTVNDIVEMVLAVEADRWDVDMLTAWYRQRTFPVSPPSAK
ncbi:MAG: type II toxin-antitoxin system death-on-curing family toxin [Candidatus Entotheonellia bacterium]